MDKDKLGDLPAEDSVQMNQQETEVMNRYFQQNKSEGGWKTKVKIISIASFSFILIANPWMDKLIENLYDFGNKAIVLLIKLTIFAVVFSVLFVMLV